MTEQELVQQYRNDQSQFENLAKQIIREVVGHPLLAKRERFFVVPPDFRLKSEDSLIEKAFYRGKKYANAYDDITDKVGVRFVSLTTDGVHDLQQVVESLHQYGRSMDRDFEEERLSHPTTFTYQSVHYILRPVSELSIDGARIPAGFPCEVQVRSILQHAYSELTHDTIYKPKTIADPAVHRLAARSMALIETTDVIFSEALKLFAQSIKEMSPMMQFILSKYSGKLNFQPEPRLNATILESIQEVLPQATEQSLERFITENDFILEKMRQRGEYKLLYRQPSIVLVYFLASTAPKALCTSWPLIQSELDPVFSDLGISRD